MVAILILLTVVVFLLADWVVQLVQARRGLKPASVLSLADMIESEARPVTDGYPGEPPTGLFFHPGHCWAQIERDGVCKVGMDGLIGQILGKVDEVYLPHIGEEVSEGSAVVSITQGSRVLSLKSPMDGIITEVNAKLKPGYLKSRPYTDGWLFTIKPKALEEDARRLVIGSEVTKWHRRELHRIAEYFASLPRLTKHLVYDSRTGTPILGPVMEKAVDSEWQKFQQLFLEGQN